MSRFPGTRWTAPTNRNNAYSPFYTMGILEKSFAVVFKAIPV